MKNDKRESLDENGADLSDDRKKELDGMFDSLVEYFNTPEGIAFGNDFENVMERLKKNDEKIENPESKLNPKEKKGLAFIMKELKKGNSPSTRQVSKALGCRSSRTGFKVMCSLKEKGLIKSNIK